MDSDLQKCSDEDELEGCLYGYRDVIEQAKVDLKRTFYGPVQIGVPWETAINNYRKLLRMKNGHQ